MLYGCLMVCSSLFIMSDTCEINDEIKEKLSLGNLESFNIFDELLLVFSFSWV